MRSTARIPAPSAAGQSATAERGSFTPPGRFKLPAEPDWGKGSRHNHDRGRHVAGDRRSRFHRIERRGRVERRRPATWSCATARPRGKWRNLAKRQLADVVPPAELMAWLDGRKLDAVIHLGAISETTATDGDLVIETNFRLSMRLLDWCTVTPRRSSTRPRRRPMATAPQGFQRRVLACDALAAFRPS